MRADESTANRYAMLDFELIANNIPHRRTLGFICLIIAFAASVVYDTLLIKSNERLSNPVAAVVVAGLCATFLFSKYPAQLLGPLIVSSWPLHLFTVSFWVVCLAYHGGDRFGQVIVYTVVGYATYAILPFLIVTDQSLFRAFVKLIAVSSGGLAVPALFASLGHASFLGLPLQLKPQYADLSGIIASGGVFEHAEGHALQMAAGMFCGLYAIRSTGGVVYWFCLLLSLAGLIVSQGRAAMLGVAVAFAIRWLPELFRRSPVAFVGSLAAFLIFPFILWPQLAAVPGIAGFLRLERGLSGREEAWQYAITLIQERPWTGFGFLASSELTELNRKYLTSVGFSGAGTTFHNTFISKSADLGLIVTGFYALLYVVPLVRICRPSAWPREQELVRSMILLTLTTALFRDYNIGGVRSTALVGAVFLGVANLWPMWTASSVTVADMEATPRPVQADIGPGSGRAERRRSRASDLPHGGEATR